MWRDAKRLNKPIIDENQAEEFDLRITYAMKYDHAVTLSIWEDGFTHDITGRIHYVDPITHGLRIELKPGEFESVAFDSIVGIQVLD